MNSEISNKSVNLREKYTNLENLNLEIRELQNNILDYYNVIECNYKVLAEKNKELKMFKNYIANSDRDIKKLKDNIKHNEKIKVEKINQIKNKGT